MERRFLVKDEEGEVLRAFFTKQEAAAYAAARPGFTVLVLPKQPKPDLLAELGGAPF